MGHSHVKIPFLTSVDDTMIFAKASTDSCLITKNILNKYCAILGQLVNYSKLVFQCFPNTDSFLREEFVSILQMEESLPLGKYLGCPIISGKVHNDTFLDIQEKVSPHLCK